MTFSSRAHMHTHARARTHTHTHMRAHARMHTHTHTHARTLDALTCTHSSIDRKLMCARIELMYLQFDKQPPVACRSEDVEHIITIEHKLHYTCSWCSEHV